MSDPERPSERHAPTTRPSLVSGEATKRVRVLDGLADAPGNTGRAAATPTPTRRVAWPLAMAFGLVVMLAIWWWTRPVAETPPETGLASAAAPATDARPAPTAEPASSPPVEASASAARIESMPEPRTVASTAPVASAAAAIAPAPPSPFPMLAERPVVRRDAARENRTARAAQRDSAKATRTARAKTPTKTDTRHARAAERRSTTTASRAGRPATGGSDPDVTLLSAMLNRLANESDRPGGASPTTLAQLVGQCERQAATSSIDAFECRRRICAGYWGKADACPAAMAPKSN